MKRIPQQGTPDSDVRDGNCSSCASVSLQPEIRGKKKKLKRNESLRVALLERLKRWNEGKVDVLWAEARKLFMEREASQAATGSLAANIRRATECAQDARCGGRLVITWYIASNRGIS